MAKLVTSIILLGMLLTVCQQTAATTITKKQYACWHENGAFFTILCTAPLKLYVVNAKLGRSAEDCQSQKKCCPAMTVCTVDAQTSQAQTLRDTCDGGQQCHVSVVQDWCSTGYTDYESVTYICTDNTSATTTHTGSSKKTSTNAVKITRPTVNTTRPTVTTPPLVITALKATSTAKVTTTAAAAKSPVAVLNSGGSPFHKTSSTSRATTDSAWVPTGPDNGDRSKSMGQQDKDGGTNIGLIAGLVTAACIIIIVAVFTVILCKRTRANHQPEMGATNLTFISDKLNQSDETYANCHSNGMMMLPPGVTKPTTAAEANTQSNVSSEDFNSKPNKQKKLDNDSQNAYGYDCVYGHAKAEPTDDGTTGSGNVELNYIEIDHKGVERATRNVTAPSESEAVTYVVIQTKTTSADTTPHDGDTDMSMVENDLYSL